MKRHQIIDRLPDNEDDPYVVLFDFEEWFTVRSGTNVGPPEMDYATSSSYLNDGENIDASRFGNRVLNVELAAFRGNAEDQAEPLQTLGRLLADPRGQWVLWQDEGTVNPRFYRTLPSSYRVDDLLLLEDPKRVLTLPIPAEPFGWGDLVVGTAAVANNPAAGARPLCFHITDVKGDVDVPISMRFDAGVNPSYLLLGSSASPDNPATLPRVSVPSSVTVPGSFTRTANLADAAAVGGVTDRWVWSGAGFSGAVASYQLPALPQGDYRILVRARGDLPIGLTPAGGVLVPRKWVTPGATYSWLDLGVARFPRGPRRTQPRGISDGLTGSRFLQIKFNNTPGPAQTVYLDEVIAVPAPLDNSVASSLMFVAKASELIVEGVEDAVWALSGSTFGRPEIEGALPRVAPGVDNLITLIKTVDAAGDVLTDVTDVTYQYRPAYLGLRSATG